jgi:hypothetical protein
MARSHQRGQRITVGLEQKKKNQIRQALKKNYMIVARTFAKYAHCPLFDRGFVPVKV